MICSEIVQSLGEPLSEAEKEDFLADLQAIDNDNSGEPTRLFPYTAQDIKIVNCACFNHKNPDFISRDLYQPNIFEYCDSIFKIIKISVLGCITEKTQIFALIFLIATFLDLLYSILN